MCGRYLLQWRGPPTVDEHVAVLNEGSVKLVFPSAVFGAKNTPVATPILKGDLIMCDYSLMGVPNRLANEGDDLVVHRFSTGTIGLVPARTSSSSGTTPQLGYRAIWKAIKDFFRDAEPNQAVAVCVPPGARLLVRDMPEDVQRFAKSGPAEIVTFTQLSAAANAHRDAIRLDNGSEILLQRLHEGQRVRVLRLTIAEVEDMPVLKTAGVR